MCGIQFVSVDRSTSELIPTSMKSPKPSLPEDGVGEVARTIASGGARLKVWRQRQ
jgi:hypothetical protein